VNSEPEQGPLISLNNTLSMFLFAGLFFVGLVPELPHCVATELFRSNTGNGILAEKNRSGDFQCLFKQPVSEAEHYPVSPPSITVYFFVGQVTVPDVPTMHCPAIWAHNMPYLESLGFM